MNPPKPEALERGVPRKVVYVPACVTRIMGPARGDYEQGAFIATEEGYWSVCCKRDSQARGECDGLQACLASRGTHCPLQHPCQAICLHRPPLPLLIPTVSAQLPLLRPAAPVHEKLLSLFNKGGYEVVYPEGLSAR